MCLLLFIYVSVHSAGEGFRVNTHRNLRTLVHRRQRKERDELPLSSDSYEILHFPGGAAGLPASESLESCCIAVSSKQIFLRQHFHSNYGLKTFVIVPSSFLSPAAPKPKLLFQLVIGSRKKRSMAFPRAKIYGLSSVICSPIKPVWSRSLEMLFRELLLKAGNNEVLFYTIDLLNLSG